jgi:hypothetical protein
MRKKRAGNRKKLPEFLYALQESKTVHERDRERSMCVTRR